MSEAMIRGDKPRHSRRTKWGRALIQFCGYGLAVSSIVKFLHPARPVAYMASMGYEGETLYVIAAIELVAAVLFLLPTTRRAGLLLVSSYIGGAIAAHLAVHRFLSGGPFLVYMAEHPYVGALVPGLLLAAAWAGAYLTDVDGLLIPGASSLSTRLTSESGKPAIESSPLSGASPSI